MQIFKCDYTIFNFYEEDKELAIYRYNCNKENWLVDKSIKQTTTLRSSSMQFISMNYRES